MKEALKIENLVKVYDGGKKALSGVSLLIPKGDFFALLGPNGAGKTTLIGIVTGLVEKTEGKVFVEGISIDEDRDSTKLHIGLVPQEFNFNIFETVEDILYTQAGYYGISRKAAKEVIDSLIEKLGLSDKRNSKAMTLSGGMKRRLMIARALVHKPTFLFLDEPTAGVDVELRNEMWSFLRELNSSGVTIVLTTHYLEEAEKLCRHIAIMSQGVLQTKGAIQDVMGGKSLEEVYLAFTKK